MTRLLITTDEHDFVVFDLSSNTITHRQPKTKELDSPNLQGKGRPTYRPFGVDVDDQYIYIASNDKLGKFDKTSYEFKGLISIPMVINTHQIVKDQDTFYVCHTAIDTIGIHDVKNKINKYINVNLLNRVDIHLQPLNADQLDSRHLNSLFDAGDKIYFCRHNKNLVESDFGYFDKINTFDIKLVARAGKCCHGIRVVDNYLYTLSTGTGEILMIDLNTNVSKPFKLVDSSSTFLRGLDVYDDKIIIGCSVNFKTNTKDQSCYIIVVDIKNNITSKYLIDGIKFINDLKVVLD